VRVLRFVCQYRLSERDWQRESDRGFEAVSSLARGRELAARVLDQIGAGLPLALAACLAASVSALRFRAGHIRERLFPLVIPEC